MKPSVPPANQRLWEGGRQLEAIKLLRQHSGLGLKEAKDLLERRPAATVPRNRAPGEQPPGFLSGPPGLLRLIALGGALLLASPGV